MELHPLPPPWHVITMTEHFCHRLILTPQRDEKGYPVGYSNSSPFVKASAFSDKSSDVCSMLGISDLKVATDEIAMIDRMQAVKIKFFFISFNFNC